jgi:hypothetical protein
LATFGNATQIKPSKLYRITRGSWALDFATQFHHPTCLATLGDAIQVECFSLCCIAIGSQGNEDGKIMSQSCGHFCLKYFVNFKNHLNSASVTVSFYF